MTEESKLSYLFSLRPDKILMTDIYRLFNKSVHPLPNGKMDVQPPMFFPTDKITVPKGTLPNIKFDIETTVGRYIFNLVVIAAAFGDKVEYINKTMRNSDFEKLQNYLCDEVLMGRISGAEFGKFQTRIIWLNNFTEILVPGSSDNLMVLPPEIRNKLQELIDANRDVILTGDTAKYINNVEKPILAFAKKWFIDHNEPGWLIYAKGGKPNFNNVFKNMFLEVGPILDITTGKYKISTNSFSEGISPEENYLYANQAVFGAYNRAVNTQKGGAKTKEFVQAFQGQRVVEDDCGSQMTIGIDVTEKNLETIKWAYVRDENNPDEFICATPDILNSFIGKHVEYRSPLYCMTDNGCFCWKCVGGLYQRMGLSNVGFASQKLTSTFLNKSLKAFHDSTVKTTVIDWRACLYNLDYKNITKMDDKEIDKYFEETKDGSIILKCAKAEFEFPEEFIDHSIAEIVGKDVNIFGLFEIKIYETEEDVEKDTPKHLFFKHIGKILTCPSSINDIRHDIGEDKNDKYVLLTFKTGDLFIKNKNIIVDSNVANTVLNVFTLGYFPNVLNYEELAKYWTEASAYNGVSLSSLSQRSIELIVSEICRDSSDLTRPFRYKLKDNPKTDHKAWKMINIRLLPKYSSVWSSLTSGDARNNLVSMVARLRNGGKQIESPLEDAIL